MRGKFRNKRQEANGRYWKDGGAPATDLLWPPASPMSPQTSLGKIVLKSVNKAFPEKFKRRMNPFGVPSVKLMEELKNALQKVIPS